MTLKEWNVNWNGWRCEEPTFGWPAIVFIVQLFSVGGMLNRLGCHLEAVARAMATPATLLEHGLRVYGSRSGICHPKIDWRWLVLFDFCLRTKARGPDLADQTFTFTFTYISSVTSLYADLSLALPLPLVLL